tara:strand:- start:304 stop:489 length:186 start_codon:yes stop_codon:yes gene_type:complete
VSNETREIKVATIGDNLADCYIYQCGDKYYWSLEFNSYKERDYVFEITAKEFNAIIKQNKI